MNEYTPESITAVGSSSKDKLKVGITEEPAFIEEVAQSQDGTRASLSSEESSLGGSLSDLMPDARQSSRRNNSSNEPSMDNLGALSDMMERRRSSNKQAARPLTASRLDAGLTSSDLMSHFDYDQGERLTLDDLEKLLHDIANVKGDEFITSFTSGGSANDDANNASTYSDLDASYSSQPGVSSAADQRFERRLKEKAKAGKGSGGRKWHRPEARAVTDSSTIRQWSRQENVATRGLHNSLPPRRQENVATRSLHNSLPPRRQENVATRGLHNALTSSDGLHGQIHNEDYDMNEYKSSPDGEGVIETQTSSELVVIKEHEEPSQTTVSLVESNSLRANDTAQEMLNPEMEGSPTLQHAASPSSSVVQHDNTSNEAESSISTRGMRFNTAEVENDDASEQKVADDTESSTAEQAESSHDSFGDSFPSAITSPNLPDQSKPAVTFSSEPPPCTVPQRRSGNRGQTLVRQITERFLGIRGIPAFCREDTLSEYPIEATMVQDDVVYEATLIQDDPELGNNGKSSTEEEVAVLVPWCRTHHTLVLYMAIIILIVVLGAILAMMLKR